MSIEGGRIIINIPLSILTIGILLGFTLWGWTRGYRYMVTIALATTLGFVLSVDAATIVSVVNGFYNFFYRLLNILIPPLASLLPSGDIIPNNPQAPLLLRALTFYILFAIGVGWKGPWEGAPFKGFSGGNQQLRLLGAITGFYIGILMTAATSTFWQSTSASFQSAVPNWLNNSLLSLPTFDNVDTVFIVSFLILLGITVMLQFLRSLQVGAAPAKK